MAIKITIDQSDHLISTGFLTEDELENLQVLGVAAKRRQVDSEQLARLLGVLDENEMDTQSKMILERVEQIRGSNNKGGVNLIGGEWLETSSFYIFKHMPIQDIGKWGEMMFNESFGLESESTGLDLPTLKADIKTFTRAYKRTKFSGPASTHLNPDWYFVYLIFPNGYQLYRIPGDDSCVKRGSKSIHGKIDITGIDIDRFVKKDYIYKK